MESYHSVVVVGAGVSGLFAASLLRTRFPDLVVLEAQAHVGGRVKQVLDFAPWPLEAGPEFVHGSTSVLVDIARAGGVTFKEREWPDWWHFGHEGKGLIADAEVDDEVEKIHDMFEEVSEEAHPPPGTDIRAIDWMRAHGATERMITIADASYANDFCCSLSQLGLRELIEESRGWRYRETYLIMDQSMGKIVDRIAAGVKVVNNWAVAQVEYSPSGAKLTATDGRVVRCDKLVITVPLRILQDGLITFSPPLPAPKRDAISRVRMGNVVKILLTFRQQIWPNGMYDVVCPDSFVPEFWMLRYDNAAEAASLPNAARHPARATHIQPGVGINDLPATAATAAAASRALRAAAAPAVATPAAHAAPQLERFEVSGSCSSEAAAPSTHQAPSSSRQQQQDDGRKGASSSRSHSTASTSGREQLFPHTMVGFIAGTRADVASALSPDAAVARFLTQLDAVFGTAADPTPASSNVAAARVVDWSKEHYVRGAYTYPTYGAELGDRAALAAPVAGTLFFAGEATNCDMNPCVQGALETGQRAALQLEAAVTATDSRPKASKL